MKSLETKSTVLLKHHLKELRLPSFLESCEKTAQRWKKGETNPKPQDVRAIRVLVGAIAPDTQKEAPPAEADGAVPGWALELTNQLRDEIRVNRETIVAALAREVTRRTLEGNEPLLRQLHDVLARVERRLEE